MQTLLAVQADIRICIQQEAYLQNPLFSIDNGKIAIRRKPADWLRVMLEIMLHAFPCCFLSPSGNEADRMIQCTTFLPDTGHCI